MQLTARTFTLELAEPFVISRSSDTESEVVQVAIRHGQEVGYGEGAPDPRYGESCQSALDFFEQAQPLLGDELIEQPLHADNADGYRELHAAALPIPIVLDESCHTLPDVGRAAGLADGVNIKLTKSGGIREAHRMIHAARSLGLRVMLGCMNESSLGIAQAAQLAPLVDVVDLDGHLLNRNDAFQGLELRDGAVLPSALPRL